MKKNSKEIFRHFRQVELSPRGEMKPAKNGGLSFLAMHNDQGQIDFWIYICPLTAGFSAKAAVKKLREIKDVAAPWGTFTLTDQPLLDQLLEQSILTDIPTDIGSLIDLIRSANTLQEEKRITKLPINTKQLYEAS